MRAGCDLFAMECALLMGQTLDMSDESQSNIVIAGRTFHRIRFGGERHREDSPCPGCGTYYGELHRPGCDFEECPACGEPSVSCGCAH